jgi:hypothetical protein
VKISAHLARCTRSLLVPIPTGSCGGLRSHRRRPQRTIADAQQSHAAGQQNFMVVSPDSFPRPMSDPHPPNLVTSV